MLVSRHLGTKHPGVPIANSASTRTGGVTRVSLPTHSQIQENTLKSNYLASVSCAAMLFACAAAYSDDTMQQRAPTTHPAFNTVDTHRHGYLTADDVKNKAVGLRVP
jgi:hypothetical protein